ncbi:MAG: ATP-binding protein [Deltaproteobacteria bacterium]|nr:ATP-binding protein [Deltaproteobacteria bacterium]
MDKNEILAILNDWNIWRGDQEAGIERGGYLDKLEGFMRSDYVITITGPRRAGKSYLMRQMMRKLREEGIKRENLLFVNFEDPRFTSLDTRVMTQVFEVYREFLFPSERPILFLDEVQEVEGWEKWVRMMHELKKAKIIVSGSNAHLLSRELGTLLTGRHLDLTVFPLSFQEFLSFHQIEINAPLDVAGRETEIKGWLRRYIESGSFPQIALSEQKREILLNYFDDLLTKDLLRRFRIRKPHIMKALIKYYLSNVSNLMTFMAAERFLHTSADTIQKFSGYFEDVYLIYFLNRFSFKVKEQEKSPRKIYAIDTGLCNALGLRFSENIGRLAENIVFLALKRKQAFQPDTELFYWKDLHHREVDFVIKSGLSVSRLIQVCWNIEDEKTKKRELGSLVTAMEELHISHAAIITEEREGEILLNQKRVTLIPLWKWLLEDESC